MLKNLVWGLVVGAALVTGLGCSGDDDDDSSGNVNDEAAAKCTNFVQVYCAGVVDCLVDDGTIATSARDANVDACVSAATKGGVDCTLAAAVSSSYDSCIAAVSNPDCAAVTAALDNDDAESLVPEVCHGVILVNR